MKTVASKYCSDCGLEKLATEYYSYKGGALHRNCKQCVSTQRASHYQANRAKVLKREADRRSQVDWSARCKEYRLAKWAKRLMQSATVCSQRRGHEPPTIDEGWIHSQPLICPYLHVQLKPSLKARDPWAPSLDRIDNSRGYTPDNVRLTSWIWNLMRGALTVDEALAAVETIKAATLHVGG